MAYFQRPFLDFFPPYSEEREAGREDDEEDHGAESEADQSHSGGDPGCEGAALDQETPLPDHVSLSDPAGDVTSVLGHCLGHGHQVRARLLRHLLRVRLLQPEAVTGPDNARPRPGRAHATLQAGQQSLPLLGQPHLPHHHHLHQHSPLDGLQALTVADSTGPLPVVPQLHPGYGELAGGVVASDPQSVLAPTEPGPRPLVPQLTRPAVGRRHPDTEEPADRGGAAQCQAGARHGPLGCAPQRAGQEREEEEEVEDTVTGQHLSPAARD